MAAQEGRAKAATVSIPLIDLRAADRRSLHVCVADGFQIFLKACERTADPAIYKSPDHDRILGDIPAGLGCDTVSFYLRFRHSLVSRLKRFLHLRVPVWRLFCARRQGRSG